MTTLYQALAPRLAHMRERAARTYAPTVVTEFGRIERIGDGVATITGLRPVRLDELLLLPDDRRAMTVSLEPERIGAVLLDRDTGIAAGDPVHGSGDVLRVPVGEGLLGRVLDPLGRPLDGAPPPATRDSEPIERPAPDIIARAFVDQPLHTGVLVVDAMVPLGRGQRELLIGDRSTGKTAVAVDAMLSQRHGDVVCVYCAVGQKAAGVRRVIEAIRAGGAFERSIFVVAEADDPPGLQWIAPYAACTMAEYFRDRGGHALLVMDDLSKHAAVHREIALLLRYPPGREAYPGDVFYLHARLLERAARLDDAHGGGSLTALPIAETQSGNLSAYIPTNLISITDGQIYLESKLFHEGQKPAVNVGKSVSRVGGRTQPPAVRTLAESLRLDYAQFTELETFTRFGQMMEPRTLRVIEHGRRIRAVLRQPQGRPLSLSVQTALLLALREGVLDGLPTAGVAALRARVERELQQACGDAVARLDADGVLADTDRTRMLDWLRGLASELGGTPP